MGIQAFEARWRALTKDHPTTKNDNTAIAQAMAQLIDQYQSPQQVEAALPEHLKLLFRELAIAYFRAVDWGLGPATGPAIGLAMLHRLRSLSQRRQRWKLLQP